MLTAGLSLKSWPKPGLTCDFTKSVSQQPDGNIMCVDVSGKLWRWSEWTIRFLNQDHWEFYSKMPFVQSLFIPCTMFFQSQQHYKLSCNAIVHGPCLCAGESYVMHRLAEIFSPLLTCSNNINFNKYLWRLAVIEWYKWHKQAIKFL